MIKKFDDRTELIFGTGDIGMNPGVYIEDDKNVGVMVCYNQEPREIGHNNADVKGGTTINMEDYPVVLKFHKVESVDVVIHALKEIKDLMEAEHGRQESIR